MASDQGRAASKRAQRLARKTAKAQRDEESRVQVLVEGIARSRLLAPLADQPQPLRPDRRALLIINSKSGKDGDSLSRVREISDILASYGIGVEVRVKLKKSIARKDARRAAKQGCQLVLAAGGDGTVAAVARGLIGTSATLWHSAAGHLQQHRHQSGHPHRCARSVCADCRRRRAASRRG